MKRATLAVSTGRARFVAVPAVLTLILILSAALALKDQWAATTGGGDRAVSDAVPYLGVTYVPLSHDAAARYGVEADVGVLLTEVAGDSPAQKAGLRRGDILLAVDSVALTRSTSLVEILLERRPGDRTSLQVLREGETFTADLVLGAR